MYEYEMDSNDTGTDETDFLAQVIEGLEQIEPSINKVLREYSEYNGFGLPRKIIEHNRFDVLGGIDITGDVTLEFEYNSYGQIITEKTSIRDLNGNSQDKTVSKHFGKAGNIESLQ